MSASLFFCFWRNKRYNLSNWKVVFCFLFFSLTGALGSNIGSFAIGASFLGRRLYGLMIVDSIVLIALHFIFKQSIYIIGDFISVPVMAACWGGKLACLFQGCCYGYVMYIDEQGKVIRFPSQLFELLLWGGLVIWIIILEQKKYMSGVLWPFAMIWFGVTRYIADFFRGVPSEKLPLVWRIPGGQFWSIVLILMGLIYLFLFLRKLLNHLPTFKEYFKACFGLLKIEKTTKQT